MEQRDRIKELAQKLRLANLRKKHNEYLDKAQQESPSYLGFLESILEEEVKHREMTARQRRLKQAGFPEEKLLDSFELDYVEGLSRTNLNNLKECEWIKKKFNLILIGPPGIGKTHLSIALGIEAIKKGYTVSFVTIKELAEMLTDPNPSHRIQSKIQRLYSNHLLIIDEVGYYPMSSLESGHFFHFLNDLHEKTSFLITSNKPFNHWPEFFGDEDLVLAALDRLLFHCDVLKLNGKSYRLENRQTLLD